MLSDPGVLNSIPLASEIPGLALSMIGGTVWLEACLNSTAAAVRRETCLRYKVEASNGVQQGKALVDKPGGLSSVPGTIWWRERTNSHKLSSDPNMHISRK